MNYSEFLNQRMQNCIEPKLFQSLIYLYLYLHLTECSDFEKNFSSTHSLFILTHQLSISRYHASLECAVHCCRHKKTCTWHFRVAKAYAKTGISLGNTEVAYIETRTCLGNVEMACAKTGTRLGNVEMACAKTGTRFGNVEMACAKTRTRFGNIEIACAKTGTRLGNVEMASAKTGTHFGNVEISCTESEDLQEVCAIP